LLTIRAKTNNKSDSLFMYIKQFMLIFSFFDSNTTLFSALLQIVLDV